MSNRTVTFKRTLQKTTLFSIAIVIVLLAGSCKKGDTGPAGTANVTYSDWFTATPWIKDTVFGVWHFDYTKSFSAITQNIVDSGTVITFGKLLGYNPSIWPTSQVGQMPISLTYQQGSVMTDTWSANVAPGQVTIDFVNDKNYWTAISTSHQFRIVIIPGGQHLTTTDAGATVYTRTGRAIDATTYEANIQAVAKGWKEMSYEEICDRLGIPE